jgi:hypothetical protein
MALSAASASAQAQANLDAGKSPAQIFSNTCNACHRSAREIKRTSPAFLREHYTTGVQEATAMAAYLASVGSDPRAVQQRRPPVMGAGQAPAAETATSRPPAEVPQAPDQPRSEAQTASQTPAAPGGRSRRPSESMELSTPSSWATTVGSVEAVAPHSPAIPPPRRHTGHDFEE